MNSKCKVVIALAIGFLAVPMARADQDQTVAGAAKEKPAAKAKHVYTDDDLPSTRGGNVAAADDQNASADDKDKKDDKDTKKDEKPASASELQKQLDSVKHDKALLEKRLEQLQDKADDATDPFRKRMYQDSISNQQVTLEQYDKQIQELEAKLTEEQKKQKENQKEKPGQ